MYLVYNFILTILSPIWLPWMWWRSRKRKESPNWSERQGIYNSIPKKDTKKKRVWVHAVSVGEVIAALPFLGELRSQNPEIEIVLSVTTSSGHQTATDRAKGLFDYLVYFPIDFAKFQLRAMQKVRPDAIAIMETELWYNFLWAADVFDVKTFIINGRISDRAFKRSKKIRWYYKSLFKYVGQTLVQTENDAVRFKVLDAQNVHVFGNTKFDENVETSNKQEWKDKLHLDERPVIVVGSTRSEKEEDFVISALEKLTQNVQVIHAPRHLESADRILSNSPGARLRTENVKADYIVLNTYGELGGIYAVADIVIIGGGFDQLGGQNIIQPLAHGKPVIHGKYMHNFRDVAAMSVDCGASISVETSEELTAQLTKLLNDPAHRKKMGEAAIKLVEDNRGASKRYAASVSASLRA
jgi:3-deoxy-D-manno-octulosonic-acid transferase